MGDNTFRTGDDISRESDDISRMKDDISRARDNISRTRDDTFRAEDDISRMADNMSREGDDMSRPLKKMSSRAREMSFRAVEALSGKGQISAVGADGLLADREGLSIEETLIPGCGEASPGDRDRRWQARICYFAAFPIELCCLLWISASAD